MTLVDFGTARQLEIVAKIGLEFYDNGLEKVLKRSGNFFALICGKGI